MRKHIYHHYRESCAVIVTPIIESERPLIHVSKQLRDITTYIRSAPRTFEKRPEILHAISVDISPRIFGHMIDCFMDFNSSV
jgi:hypothetical protein